MAKPTDLDIFGPQAIADLSVKLMNSTSKVNTVRIRYRVTVVWNPHGN